jgi:hypothetical protein
MPLDYLEWRMLHKLGDYRQNPVRRRAVDTAIRERKNTFPDTMDRTDECDDWLINRIAQLELAGEAQARAQQKQSKPTHEPLSAESPHVLVRTTPVAAEQKSHSRLRLKEDQYTQDTGGFSPILSPEAAAARTSWTNGLKRSCNDVPAGNDSPIIPILQRPVRR